jgi:AraC-like DNA-binding protein
LPENQDNGHSQTYFFIEPYQISAGTFTDHVYHETDFIENHNMWKRLIKMMNVLYAGDICYTGFHCQNPLYDGANVVSYKNVNQLYTVSQLYNHCIQYFEDPTNLDYYFSYLRKQALLTKSNKHKVENAQRTIIHFLEDTQSQVLPQTVVESLLDESIDAYEDSINKRIFIVCCQISKSFKSHNSLDWSHFDEICATSYSNFTKQDYAAGYTCQELINRIRSDIHQIIIKDSHHNMNWDKVGYTNEQRARSLETRRSQMIERQNVVQSYLYSNNKMTNSVHLSQRALARLISKETGYNARTVLEDIRSLMSQEAIKMSKNEIIKNEIVENEEQFLHTLYYSNNKMYTVYTDDVQTLTCKQWCEKYNKSRSLYYKYKTQGDIK